jgi:transcriptional regulator with XRE-family HTH domain|tara:strand:+ start:442 stop:798 length:357 start_codon:yes stop_codon:yes gene_type:complete
MVIEKRENDLPTLELGKYIKEKREDLGVSQRAMAKIIGKSNVWLMKLESGVMQMPRAIDIQKIADFFQVKRDVLWVKGGYIDNGFGTGIDFNLLAQLVDLDEKQQKKVSTFVKMIQDN